MKGYKITNCAKNKRIGIVGSSFKDVFTKGCMKLKVTTIHTCMFVLYIINFGLQKKILMYVSYI